MPGAAGAGGLAGCCRLSQTNLHPRGHATAEQDAQTTIPS
jgi:hypothetical protein